MHRRMCVTEKMGRGTAWHGRYMRWQPTLFRRIVVALDAVGFVSQQIRAVVIELWIPLLELGHSDAVVGFDLVTVVARDNDVPLLSMNQQVSIIEGLDQEIYLVAVTGSAAGRCRWWCHVA